MREERTTTWLFEGLLVWLMMRAGISGALGRKERTPRTRTVDLLVVD